MALRALQGPTGGGAPVGGTGTTNTIPRWTGPSTLGDSVITQSGNNIGVGEPSPAGRLQVQGLSGNNTITAIGSTTTGQSYGIFVQAGTNASDRSFGVYNTSLSPYLFVRGDGNVGIGTASPGTRLHVLASGTDQNAILANASATRSYTEYRYNTSTTLGFFGTASGLVSGGASADFAWRVEGSNNLIFATGTAERARITTTSLDISSTSGYGVKLPATPGNADTQTLDCYQENTWTPTLSAAATWGGTAPTITSARYTRVGRTITCSVILAATGGAAYSSTWGSTTISAPFASGEYSVVPCAREAPGGSNGIQQTSTVYLPTTASSTAAYWITWTYQV